MDLIFDLQELFTYHPIMLIPSGEKKYDRTRKYIASGFCLKNYLPVIFSRALMAFS